MAPRQLRAHLVREEQKTALWLEPLNQYMQEQEPNAAKLLFG